MKTIKVILLVWVALLWIGLLALTVYAQEIELAAPSCLRILKATQTEAVLQFEPHGGEVFEAERLSGTRWRSISASVKTSGKTYSLIVPLLAGNMNNIRICAAQGDARVCSTEGVYAKR